MEAAIYFLPELGRDKGVQVIRAQEEAILDGHQKGSNLDYNLILLHQHSHKCLEIGEVMPSPNSYLKIWFFISNYIRLKF